MWKARSVLGMLLLGVAVTVAAIAIAGGYSGCLTGCNPAGWAYGLWQPVH